MIYHHKPNVPFAVGAQQAGQLREPNKRRPTGRLKAPMMVAASLVSLMLVQGCAKHSKNNFVVGSVTQTYKERHPIVLQEQEKTLDIPVASSGYGLPIVSSGAVKDFSRQFRKSANGVISVMLPSGSKNEAAARTIGHKVVNVIQDSGVPRNRISMVTYFAGDHGDSAPIRLSYGAIQASVAPCGKWKKDLTETRENKNYHNFGCASQQNLAAIIANPADLLGPRGTTGIDAARRGDVIEGYRKGEESGTPDDRYGKISPVFAAGGG